MRSNIIKAGLLGGAIFFLWASISWMILPWHCMTMSTFSNESEVSKVILENSSEDGVYFLPNVYCHESKGSEEFDKKMNEGRANMKVGPIIFASVQRKGLDPNSPLPYTIMLLIYLVSGCLISTIVAISKLPLFWQRVGLSVLIALIVGILGELPGWNWYGFSISYVLVEIAELLIGWFLGGLIIAVFTKLRVS